VGQVFDGIDDGLRDFLAAQPVFFVATAPHHGGHVNVSPKGYADTFAVVGPRTVAYLDLTGSGVETIAHLRENGRVTLMFCSFGRAPRIVRLYGTGRVVEPDDADWPDLCGRFGAHTGARAVVVVELSRVADSCGWAVPQMQLVQERDVLERSHGTKGPDGLVRYRAERNAASIDGLAGLDATRE
jgi:Pyridoxamine 5'-phosphate oxidase